MERNPRRLKGGCLEFTLPLHTHTRTHTHEHTHTKKHTHTHTHPYTQKKTKSTAAAFAVTPPGYKSQGSCALCRIIGPALTNPPETGPVCTRRR